MRTPLTPTEQDAINIVRKAHDAGHQAIVTIRIEDRNIVDATGDVEGITRMLLNAIHHISQKLPEDTKHAFLMTISMGANELSLNADNRGTEQSRNQRTDQPQTPEAP